MAKVIEIIIIKTSSLYQIQTGGGVGGGGVRFAFFQKLLSHNNIGNT